MIDERAIALINLELDGEITDDERKELTGILEASREARDYRDSYRQMHALLSDAPRQDLPRDLHERVMSGMQAPVRVTRPSGGRLPAIVRYGLAASVGLMVAVGFYEAQPHSADVGAMTGTIAPANGNRLLDSYDLDQVGTRARARLSRHDGSIVLDVNLQADEPTDIDIDLGPAALRLDGFTQQSGQAAAISFDNQVLRIRGNGRQHFSVSLSSTGDAVRDSEFVVLGFSRNGRLIDKSRLRFD